MPTPTAADARPAAPDATRAARRPPAGSGCLRSSHDKPPTGPDHVYSRGAAAMGTRITVTIWGDDEAKAAGAASSVFAEFERVDRLMTSWLDDSDVSRINAAAGGDPVKVDPEVLGLIKRTLEVSKASGGAFDITVGAFRGLWKFDQDLDGSIPTQAQVKARLPLVDWKDVSVDAKAGTVKLARKGMRITLGGAAKGYAVDQAVAMLRKHDFVDFMVQAGGDLYVAGRRGDRRWCVGIRDPRGEARDSFALVDIEDATFSTSGDYERTLVRDGVRYHHIIDPVTGNPAARSRSVTVLAKSALAADLWSTTLFILGYEKGLKIVEADKDMDAVFVDAANKVHISSGLKDRLIIAHQPTPGI